ncbi:glycosyltransferase [Phormidium tenue FACHB-886]|nr:glycosyltransferase [Phormidium tenue FACHB-886]
MSSKKVLCINTGGKGDLHGLRMRRLARRLHADVTYYDLDRSVSRLTSAKAVWKLINSDRWDLIYQESTGIASGINLIRAARQRQQPFIVSSGDPIGGFFHDTKGYLWGQSFEIYERLLYQSCAGYIGWTPYLTGAALKLGAKRAATVEGGVDLSIFYPYTDAKRLEIRAKLGIPADHLVCGVVGSLIWVHPKSYCYGYELVEMIKRIKRQDVSVLIVGDGDGRSRLEAAIPEALRSRVVFTGRIPEAEVVDAINVMNIGFVTQFPGKLGCFRLTTKLPEYLGCGVPVAMSPIPGFYDYAASAGWALPPQHPSSPEFLDRCAEWVDQLSWSEVEQKSEQALQVARRFFDYEVVGAKFCNFVHELLYGSCLSPRSSAQEAPDSLIHKPSPSSQLI